MRSPLDIRIVKFIRRYADLYVSKRMRSLNSHIKSPEELWISNFANEEESFQFQLTDSIKINLYKDDLLCKCIYNSFEENEITFLKNFLKPDDCFFDIGTNIGLFSLHASPIVGANGNIYAFEPTPRTFDRLEKNILLNNFTNIQTENIGLSNEVGKIEFYTANNGMDALNSILKLNELGDNYTKISVETNTVDNYIVYKKINKINLVKLDVEGWEYNVLKGAVDLLKHPDAPVFMVEFTENNAFAAGYYLGELFDYVKSFGYNWYSYDAKENKLNLEVKKLHYPYDNLIAIKDIIKVYDRLGSV